MSTAGQRDTQIYSFSAERPINQPSREYFWKVDYRSNSTRGYAIYRLPPEVVHPMGRVIALGLQALLNAPHVPQVRRTAGELAAPVRYLSDDTNGLWCARFWQPAYRVITYQVAWFAATCRFGLPINSHSILSRRFDASPVSFCGRGMPVLRRVQMPAGQSQAFPPT